MNRAALLSAFTATFLSSMMPIGSHAATVNPSADTSRQETTVTAFRHLRGDQAVGTERARVQQQVDETMRRSGMISPSDLEVWTGAISGEPFSAILPAGSTLKSASLVTTRGSNDVGEGVQIEESSSASGTPLPVGHLKSSQGTPLREHCRTIWFGVRGGSLLSLCRSCL